MPPKPVGKMNPQLKSKIKLYVILNILLATGYFLKLYSLGTVWNTAVGSGILWTKMLSGSSAYSHATFVGVYTRVSSRSTNSRTNLTVGVTFTSTEPGGDLS